MLVQRDSRLFWDILFRQNFDLSAQEIRVRFAGEAAADVGGPFREFLTLSMQRFGELSYLLIGEPGNFAFKQNPEALLQKKLFKLGQITALSILFHGRGPECLHPSIVRALFNIGQPDVIEHINDAETETNLTKLEEGNIDCLLDLNINPGLKDLKELKRIYFIASIIHNNFSSIEKFSQGIRSVSKYLGQI